MKKNNSTRNKLNLFIWFSSGLSIRELFSTQTSGSNYYAIGSMNLLSVILVVLISSFSVLTLFPTIIFFLGLFLSLVPGIVNFIFNRQTIQAFTNNNIQNKRNHFLTFLPFLLFAMIAGYFLSISLKMRLFNIAVSNNFINRFKSLYEITSNDISAQIISWLITILVILVMILPALIQYYSLKSSSRGDRGSILNEIMWFCSGANVEIIRRCPNDYSKYFGMGGTILFTALMATLSGGYAFYTAFDNPSLAICFGLFWGAMIFNLDRFIVNTMYSDNKHSISSLELLSGLPRIIIAIFLGIVISYPLELKLFEDEINAEIEVLKIENLKQYNSKLNKEFNNIPINNKEYKELEKKKDSLQNSIDIAKRDWESVKKVAQTSYYFKNGQRLSKTIWVWPEEYYTKKKYYDEIKQRNNGDIEDLRNRMKLIQSKISQDENVRSGYEKGHDKANIALNDLSTRMEAFEALKEKKSSIGTSSLFIMLLLIIIEIAPVLFKMMLSSGDYDVILETEKNKIKIKEAVKISEQNDWANTRIAELIEENKKKITQIQNELTAELQANEELLKSIASAQAEIAKVAVEKWKEEEMNKAANNPGQYLQTNSEPNKKTKRRPKKSTNV
jgi:hypothetical protein